MSVSYDIQYYAVNHGGRTRLAIKPHIRPGISESAGPIHGHTRTDTWPDMGASKGRHHNSPLRVTNFREMLTVSVISAACHKKPLQPSVSGVGLLYRQYRQPRLFCETSAEVTNYVVTFCETMWKPGATEIERRDLGFIIT